MAQKIEKGDCRRMAIIDFAQHLMKAGEDAIRLLNVEEDEESMKILASIPTSIMVLSKGIFYSLKECYDCDIVDDLMAATEGKSNG